MTARGMSATRKPAPIRSCSSGQKRRGLAIGVMGGKVSTFGAVAVLLASARKSQRQGAWRAQPSRRSAVDLAVTKSVAPSVSAMDVLKPFLMLACVAFVTGFVGYLTLSRMTAPSVASAQSEVWSSTVSAPAPDYANPGKRI